MATVSRWLTFIRAWTLPVTTERSFFSVPTSWNPVLRGVVFGLCLLPFFALVRAVVLNTLGPDPAEHLMHVTGEWVMRFLVLVLLATPLARHGWPRLARYRRMLGLYVWFYATLHLLVFAQVFIGWSAVQLIEELAERPYVLVGFLAWLMLVPMGITSAHSIRRKMGRHWRTLHRMIYGVVVLGWLHLLWLSRSDVGDAFVYGVIFFWLRIWRLNHRLSHRRQVAG
jgi:sulfoxide reductase heme-binding subunit YedZ